MLDDLPGEIVGGSPSLHDDQVGLTECGCKLHPSFRIHTSGNDSPVLEVPVCREHTALEGPLGQIQTVNASDSIFDVHCHRQPPKIEF